MMETLRTAGTAVKSCLCTVRMLPRTFAVPVVKHNVSKLERDWLTLVEIVVASAFVFVDSYI